MSPFRKLQFVGIAILLAVAVLLGWKILHQAASIGNTGETSKHRVNLPPAKEHSDPGPAQKVNAAAVISQPASDASDAELLDWARKEISRSAEAGISWARSQPDVAFRHRLLLALSQAWGETFPAAAMHWAMSQSGRDRQSFTEAALIGALHTQMNTALSMAQNLLEQEPDFGGDCVGSILSRLARQHDFTTASRLAAIAPQDFQAEWTSAVFRAWAQNQPQDAVQALADIQDAELRESTFKSVVKGWSAAAPASLAAYAETLPSGADRQFTLRQALDNWSLQDPAALGSWLNTLPAGPDFDEGASLMLAKADGANIAPNNAMKWVEAISDPKLKFDSFAHVLVQWHQENPAASQQYVAAAKWLSETQREKILNLLGQLP